MPVPLRVIVFGPARTLLLMVMVALRKLATVGVKVAVKVQLAFTASVRGEMGHVFVCAKSPGLSPPNTTLVMISGPVPVFVMLVVNGELVVPLVVFGKLRDAELSVMTGATPLPVSVTICVAGEALSVMVIEALREPVYCGWKVVLMVQDLPAST